MKTTKKNILGYEVIGNGQSGCLEEILDRIVKGNSPYWLACLNPNAFEVSRKDGIFAQALKNADWLVPDGIGILIASWFLGGGIKHRVTGSDIFYGVQEKLNQMNGRSVFFLGASEETLSAIREKMKKDFPNLRVAGTFSPPFKAEFTTEELDAMIMAVNSAEPDVLWVGMTAPKQEKWIYENRKHLKVKFVGAIGAVFDYYTNRVRRAHPFLRKLGLEWLVRLIREPRRVWKRYLLYGPLFLWHVLTVGKSKNGNVQND